MTTSVWTKGLGATGSIYGTMQPLVTTGDVWFVDSASGTDDDSPRGKNELYPLATLVQAVDNAVDGDIIVLASTHSETLSANGYLSLDKRVTILGQGQSAGVPCATLNLDYEGGVPLEFGASEAVGCCVSNVRFTLGASLESSNCGISVVVGNILFDTCYFEVRRCTMMRYYGCAAGSLNVNCTFVNVTASPATPVEGGHAIYMAGSSHVRMKRLTLDAGAVGWKNGIALDASTGGQQIDLRLEDLTLLRGSDVDVYPTSSGQYNISNESSGQGRVHW